jgi:hypothetical protein
MTFRIGLSPKVHEYIGEGNLVEKEFPKQMYNVTIILVEEDAMWVRRGFDRYRPHFVETLEDAKEVYESYKRLL